LTGLGDLGRGNGGLRKSKNEGDEDTFPGDYTFSTREKKGESDLMDNAQGITRGLKILLHFSDAKLGKKSRKKSEKSTYSTKGRGHTHHLFPESKET